MKLIVHFMNDCLCQGCEKLLRMHYLSPRFPKQLLGDASIG
jgi:hypothetical protein